MEVEQSSVSQRRLVDIQRKVTIFTTQMCSAEQVKSVQSALRDLKRPPERLQSQCNYRPFIT